MVRVKNNVSLDNVHPRVFLIIGFAAPIWEKYGSTDLWITGGNEGGHSAGARGFHRLPDGTCQAVDLRTWTIANTEHRRQAAQELAGILGPLFDVLFEEEIRDPTTGKVLRGEHAHCQYDPERPGTSAG
jgi:hypothetical protein